MRQVRSSDQSYQSDWMTWDSLNTIPEQIIQYMETVYWIYDADTCGNETLQFVVRDSGVETYWEVEHAWWIEYEPEWDLPNEFDIKQVDSVIFEYPRINRDWLKLTQR